MDSCVSAKGERSTSAKNPAQNFLLSPLTSPTFNFIHSTSFSRQPSSLNPDFPFPMGTSNVVREVQESILSSFDKCLKVLDKLKSQNGIIDKIMSLSSHLQKGCQIPRRNFRNVGMVSNSNFAAILPGDSVAGVVVGNGVMNFLNIYNTLLVVRLVLTWFPSAPPAIVGPLSTLCDPYLNIFRGIIPPLGGTLDLSPILAFLVLNAFTSAAAALPAELPSSKQVPSPSITSSQKKWMTRLSGNKPTSSTDPKL